VAGRFDENGIADVAPPMFRRRTERIHPYDFWQVLFVSWAYLNLDSAEKKPFKVPQPHTKGLEGREQPNGLYVEKIVRLRKLSA